MKKALILLVILVAGVGLFFILQNKNGTNNFSPNSSAAWVFDFDNKAWKANGNPPKCPDPLVIDPPVDVNLASGILYPGQYRGGDYKPHGGFRFDNMANNLVTVTAPIDGYLDKASRHLEEGETQYSLYFINDCGILFKLDHLLTLTPKFQAIVEKIPMGNEGDSRTTEVSPKVFVAKGELVATEVGFKDYQGAKNIFMDFGLYDLRTRNEASKNPAFAKEHKGEEEYSFNALCWLDYLNEPSRSVVKNLPAADGQSGKTSDYCN